MGLAKIKNNIDNLAKSYNVANQTLKEINYKFNNSEKLKIFAIFPSLCYNFDEVIICL